MNIIKILAELRAELAVIDEAIAVLEPLAGGHKTTSRAARGPAAVRKRRPFSEETKKKMALAQKKRWAAYRKTKKAPPQE